MFVALAAYLLGSIPTGYLVARAKGVDIRMVGSGNIGATNVFRILGKPAGIFVLLADALKGWVAVRVVAVWLAETLLPPDSMGGSIEIAAILAALFAVLGHNYTCWLRFKGGKGIATSAGVLTALVPWALLIILGVWIVLFVLTRYVSLGSISAAAVLPFATWLTTQSILLTVVTSAMSALAIYKHKGNIRRLLDGTESRISFKRKGTAS
ncbi:MAG TPA: glycerol-3-phosphate 1-O-acyltransferase PlsY [Verrucomicrobiae bacterium]|nr:glycerol-3-phosphate 1-O-acyltransferase PlsY [Verrucomicrobiae bacterium]